MDRNRLGSSDIPDPDPHFDSAADKMCDLLKQLQEAHIETRSELAQLKLENSRLELANRALCQKLAVSEERLARLLPCHVARLPHEILLIVLRHTLPPAWLLSAEPWLAPFPRSIWSADRFTKLDVVLVSKTWHRVGVELLYETVTLRSLSRMISFISALESRQGLGTLVKNLEIRYSVCEDFFTVHKAEIEKILQLCPRLAAFGFSPTDLVMDWKRAPSLPLSTHCITSLTFNELVGYSATVLPILLQLCRHLRSFALRMPSIPETSPHPTINLENLEELRLFMERGDMITSKWLMPRLRRVWIRGPSAFGTWGRKPLLPDTALERYGRTIRFLSLSNFAPETGTSAQGLLESYTALEHLAVSESLCLPGALTHRTLISVDVFCFPDGHSPVTFESLKAGFPALQHYRALDVTMSELRDIPSGDFFAEERRWQAGYQDNPSDDSDGSETDWIAAVMATDPNSDDSDDSDYVFSDETDEDSVTESDETDKADSDDSDLRRFRRRCS
ncbi:hypothetical protein DFH09DRAFT_1186261 [Mycena vulgaris]|nr:hypothetical protein DFH09DRAFT_1186261 [Mycena vulgaris]